MSETENVAALIPPAITTPTLLEADKVVVPGEKVDEVKPHPLEPGGIRFNQIYARAKSAEEELEIEREKRIRAETERDLAKSSPPSAPATTATKEYTDDELIAMLASGQATQAQVDSYKEDRLEQRVTKKLEARLDGRQRDESRSVKLSVDFNEYMKAIPNIGVQGTEERKAVDAEFDWLVETHGANPTRLTPLDRQSLALNAVRNVFGPLGSLRQRTTPPVGEIHRGSIGGVQPLTKPNPDQTLLDALKPEEVAHYEKMMRAGRYTNGWADVVEELKFTPPPLKSGQVRR